MEPSNPSMHSLIVILKRLDVGILVQQPILLSLRLQIRMNCKQNATIARTYKPASTGRRTAVDPGNRQVKNHFFAV